MSSRRQAGLNMVILRNSLSSGGISPAVLPNVLTPAGWSLVVVLWVITRYRSPVTGLVAGSWPPSLDDTLYCDDGAIIGENTDNSLTPTLKRRRHPTSTSVNRNFSYSAFDYNTNNIPGLGIASSPLAATSYVPLWVSSGA